jgi:hypothetical protein
LAYRLKTPKCGVGEGTKTLTAALGLRSHAPQALHSHHMGVTISTQISYFAYVINKTDAHFKSIMEFTLLCTMYCLNH